MTSWSWALGTPITTSESYIVDYSNSYNEDKMLHQSALAINYVT